MQNYLNLLQEVLDTGTEQENRTGINAISIPGSMLKFDLSKGFPVVTTKKLAFNSMKGELLGFIEGATSAARFRELGCNFWNQNANDNTAWLANPNRKGVDDLGLIYGALWRNWPKFEGHEENDNYPVCSYIDQLQTVIDTIKNDPTNRRIIISAWRPDMFYKMALPPCFSGDAIIAIPNGYINIDLIKEGDMVLSGTGIPRRVNQVWRTWYRGPMRQISIRYNNTPFECTTNHPFLIKGKGWVNAGDLKIGDRVAIPKPKAIRDHEFSYSVKKGLKNNPDGMLIHKTHALTINDYFMLGYYLGNGWINDKKKRVSFAIPHKKADVLLPKIRESIKVCKKNGPSLSVASYELDNQKWYKICLDFGRGAFGKRIPDWIFTSTEEAKKAFLEGYTESDGHTNDAGTILFTTVSPYIAYGIQRLCTMLDKVMSVRLQKRPPFTQIEGRVVRQRDTYSLSLPKTTQNKGMEFDENNVWLPITEIKDYSDELYVYNLDVEEEHTYLVSNIVTHNCHVLYQFIVNVKTKELNLCLYQRSSDLFLGVPMNIASASLLLSIVAKITGYTPRHFTHFMADTHIYVNHIDQVKLQLSRKPLQLPKLIIGDVLVDINEITPSSIWLENYQHHPAIKAEMAI